MPLPRERRAQQLNALLLVMLSACSPVAQRPTALLPPAQSTHRPAGNRPREAFALPIQENYRSAVENYQVLVTQTNQRPIGPVAAPHFARYLNEIHCRLHPIFADSFLAGLDQLPAAHQLNDPSLTVTLELVFDARGHLARRGVVQSSGVTAFDIGSIAAVERAAPFPPPHAELHSSDGQVYIHWTLRRDQMACSTLHAHPYRLAF
jgi:TonB family protein